jgi:CxxC motif-containing protein (DUF1111 family)
MKKKSFLLAVITIVTASFIIIYPQNGLSKNQPNNRTVLSGGELATVFNENQNAFAQPLKNLDRQRRRTFAFGDHLFNTQWVQAPSSITNLDGLGPLFNRNSCAGCHIRDGRSRPPLPTEDKMLSELIRLSIAGETEKGEPLPHPIYGGQLQEQSILGIKAEGKTNITWQEEKELLPMVNLLAYAVLIMNLPT